MNVIEKAQTWIAQDPDPETQAELRRLIASEDRDALEARFGGMLEFGTAGLRGLLGAGPARMNRVNVIRVTHGFCAWLQEQVPEIATRGICVAHDARTKSDIFARDVIEVALGAGIPVHTYSTMVATPLLAFAVREIGSGGGVMITASHNPPEYNGYKVFWENGAQIIPPNDVGIANKIAIAPSADAIPRVSMEEGKERKLLRNLDRRCAFKYVHDVADAVRRTEQRRTIHIAYTALHGVAERLMRAVFSRTGFCKVTSVREQARPDPSFPTVDFPNPEEAGAMDRVLQLGKEVDADLALANDPDGDRLAVAVRHGGVFERLSGNEIGILLANDLLEAHADFDKPLVISTVVSSPMLGPVAKAHGARWEQTLTGHKWIQNRALELESEGYQFVFGYEEALGYAPLPIVRDKDGVSSALLIADLASRLKAEGRTLIDARNDLWRQHGVVEDRQIAVWFDGEDGAAKMAGRVRALRNDPPRTVAGLEIVSVRDLLRQVRWTPDGEKPDTSLPKADVLLFELHGGHRVMARPSGTEPKLKYYLYAQAEAGADFELGRQTATDLLDRMVAEICPSDC